MLLGNLCKKYCQSTPLSLFWTLFAPFSKARENKRFFVKAVKPPIKK
jgi:hypothetical protein